MGRFHDSSQEDDNETGIDMSPLIDCVFILLIFFIVTTVFVEETGVEVDKPQAASSVQLEKNSILIAVTDKGNIVYGGSEVSLGRVQAIVRGILQSGEEVPVIVQADKDAPAGVLVKVVGEAKLGGAHKVSVATRMQKS